MMFRALLLLVALVPLAARADYAVIPYGQAYVREFTLRLPDASGLTNGLTIAAADCKLSKAGGATANCATTPTAVASSDMYTLTIGATEASTTRIEVVLKSGSSAYFAREFQFETCGTASARWPTCPTSPWDTLIDGSITARCGAAMSLAYATGRYTTVPVDSTTFTTTYLDPSGLSNRIVGTVTTNSRGSMTINCPP
jgi:hypothetical protein